MELVAIHVPFEPFGLCILIAIGVTIVLSLEQNIVGHLASHIFNVFRVENLVYVKKTLECCWREVGCSSFIWVMFWWAFLHYIAGTCWSYLLVQWLKENTSISHSHSL
jgi:hypothetical protein